MAQGRRPAGKILSAPFQDNPGELYYKEILQNLNSLRHESSLCDVTLVVEGREFKAHRNVLAASSPYFRNMFTSDMREKTEGKVTIEALTSSVMEDLLSYLYTGAVEVTNDSCARDLLFASDYLMVPRLNKMAGDFLLRDLSVSTCISVYQLAVATRNEVLRAEALSLINKHFLRVTKSKDFMSLSVDEVIECVSSDDVEIRAEEEIFDVVIRWVEDSPDRRKEYLRRLPCHVRLTLIPLSYLHSKVLQNGFVKENQDCMELVLQKMGELANQQDGGLSEKPRRCLETHVHCLLACGGCIKTRKEPSNVNCCFVPGEGKWYRLKNMTTKQSCHTVVSCQGFVYSLGGFKPGFNYPFVDKVERFDPALNSWIKIAPVPTLVREAAYVGAASLNGLLYVCGGSKRSLGLVKFGSKHMFSYNPKTNSWQKCAPMIHSRAALCTVAAGQHIYAIGGEGENGAPKNKVERFDPRSNKWKIVAPMTHARKSHCGVTFKKKIFVFGGVTGNSRSTHSAEMYDIGDNQWQEISNMQVPRVCAGATVVQGLIYIIGGNRPIISAPDAHKRMIECYNPSTGQWADKGSFCCNEFVKYFACCPVMIPKNLFKSLSQLKW